MRPNVIVHTLVLCCLALLPLTGYASENSLTARQMREDLLVLKQQWAPLDKSFSPDQRQAFERHLASIENDIDRLTGEAFAMEIMRSVAIARNGHTNANIGSFLGDDLPVRLWWFADGLYVVKAHPDYARLLGARIEKVGSLTAAEAEKRLKPYLAGTDQRIHFLSPGYLVTPRVLQHIGAVEGTTKIPLTLDLGSGALETVSLPVVAKDPGDERRAGLNRGYSVLIPDADEMAGRWPHVLDHVKERPRLYTPRGDVTASFLDDGKTTLYIRNDTVRSIDGKPLVEKFASIIHKDILSFQPKHIVVDLRLNNGGDFFNSILFAQALPRLLPDQGRISVLVGRATFSAGIVTAALIEGSGGKMVSLIGEKMGDGGQFWAEGDKITLPNSKISVRYSSEFENYEQGCSDIRTCYWATVAFGPRDISLAPEITVDVSFDDYVSGRDPVLGKALELAR
jgi:hypothetical protein